MSVNKPVKMLHPLTKLFLLLTIVFLSYSLITVIIFKHRVVDISTHYTMPDVDTDAGLWYQWYLSYIQKNGLVYDMMNFESYPVGYDISFTPSKNLIYSTHVFILNNIIGYSWQNLILINNISSLVVYPLAALGAFILSYYITRNKLGSFISGLVYGFCFYAIFMGRGAMSINHIELIPFYLLSLIYYLDNRRISSLVVSVFVFGIMFRVDAYYAFWSGLFSTVFVFLYKTDTPINTLKSALRYYIPLFTVLLLMNLEFLISQLPIMLNKQTLIQMGRNSNPRGELTGLQYYLSLPLYPINRLKEHLGPISFFMTLPLYGAAILLYARKKRLYLILLACFLFSVVLSSFVPGFYQINLLYFKYFGMFRGVGRLAMFAALFLALLSGIGISELVKTTFYLRLPKIKLLAFPLAGLIILISNLNNDVTWYRLTDISKIQKLYDPIVRDRSIIAIASYPMNLGSGNVGFPQPYELIGQIIHGKPLAAGLSRFATNEQRELQSQIKDINNPKTIDALAKYGINTVLIRNKLLADSLIVNSNLKADPRLRFVGNYSAPTDEKNGKTNNDKSRDISLYQLKEPLLNSQNKPILYLTNPKTMLTFEKISASKYTITINDLDDSDILVLNLPYSEKWKLFEGDLSKASDLGFFIRKPVLVDKQSIYQNYANGWRLDEFKDKTDIKLTLFFKPRSVIYLDKVLAFSTTFVLCVLYFIYKLKERRGKNN